MTSVQRRLTDRTYLSEHSFTQFWITFTHQFKESHSRVTESKYIFKNLLRSKVGRLVCILNHVIQSIQIKSYIFTEDGINYEGVGWVGYKFVCKMVVILSLLFHRLH